MDVNVVITTFPDKDSAREIGQSLVEERLAACVNLIPEVESFYLWEGKMCESSEVKCLLKTCRGKLDELKDRLVTLHPYEIPELLVLQPAEVGSAYGQWLVSSLIG